MSFAERFLGGHVHFFGITIYGENAMHWAVNIRLATRISLRSIAFAVLRYLVALVLLFLTRWNPTIRKVVGMGTACQRILG